MDGEVKYSIQPSSIHGLGVIATQYINRNETIGVVVTASASSIAVTEYLGKYLNHSGNANCKLAWNKGNYDLIATTNIAPDEEITCNYYDTPWFLEKPKPGYR